MKNKKERLLVLLTFLILLIVAVFSYLNRETLVYLFKQMVTGVSIVKEYVQSLGLMGILAMSLIIIVCFFFPVVSSVPIQLASSITYGLPFGFLHVVISIFLASQLAFLFTRTFRVFQSPRQRQKQLEMEEKIRGSSRSILYFLFLAYLAPFVPFFLIHMVAANSGMKWWKYSLVTLLGPMPDVIVTLWLGEKVVHAPNPIVSYGMLLLIVVCVALSMIYREKLIDWIFQPRKEEKKKDGE